MTSLSNPLVSIVTPSFNQGKFLERTILSVLNQDYPNIQYIVIDGASSDDSLQIIRQYQDQVDYWISEKDQGQTDAINKGFAKAKGEIFAWINSDDTYQPGAVAGAVEYLLGNPGYAGVYADANFVDEKDRIVGKFPAAQTDYSKLRCGYVHIPQQTFFFQRFYWDKVGPLDTSFRFAMDYDLWVRLTKFAPLRYLPGRLWANFRLHSNSKTILSDAECWPEMLRVHYREGGDHFSPIVIKYHLRKWIAPILMLRRKALFRKRNQYQ